MLRITLIALLAACGSKSDTPVPTASAVPTKSKPRITCDAEIHIECPDGYENGCAGGRTTAHACVRKGLEARSTCDTQIVHTCPDGEIDSCAATPPYGNHHICVKQ